MGRGMLILTSGFLIVLGIIQLAINNRQKAIPERNASYMEKAEVQNVSNSLMDYAVAEIETDQSWDQGFSSNDFMGAQGSVEVFEHQDFLNGNPGIPSDHDIDNWNEFTILIVSRVTHKGFTTSTEVAMTQDSFSKYTYFTDTEDSNIYFFDDDVMEGPVHTNGTLKIAGSPTFKGKVTSPNDWEGHPSYNNDPDFQADTNFSHQRIELPINSGQIDNLRSKGMSGGLRFDNHIRAHFRTEIQGSDTLGRVDIAEWNGSGWNSESTYDLSTINGVISATGQIHTKGKLKGQVTLHSEELVEIDGDLTYSNDPLQNSSSTDLLGIVSEGDVRVDENAHQDVGTQDVNIHASIMAVDQSFYVEEYWDGSPRGSLNLLGGLQQQRRGAVGTFSGGGLNSGFQKAYSYDERLLKSIPPAYPRESFFSKVYWKDKPVVKAGN